MLGTSLIHEKTRVGRKSLSFTDIIGEFLTYIKYQAEQAASQTLEHVVMGRPVYFHEDDQRADKESEKCLERIANDIGFRHVSFQYEPIAAAFSHERKIAKESLSLVVDMGGGTSDFSIIKLRPDSKLGADRASDILANTGVRVGGTHFDSRLSMRYFMEPLGLGSQYRDIFDVSKILDMPQSVYNDLSSWPKVHFAQTPKAISHTKELMTQALEPEKLERLLTVQEQNLGHAYLQSAEDSKIRLTSQDRYVCAVDELSIEVAVEQGGFVSAIEMELARVSASIGRCLADAGVQEEDIDLIILTGGSTELPVINQLIQARFPQAAISQSDKLGSVGHGLGYHAASVFV